MRLLHRSALRMLFSAAASGLLIALLVVTIHFTRYDLQWLAFLGGVLFAAVLALASQASKVEWRLMRRSRQLERLRRQLDEETEERRRATRAHEASERRGRSVTDHLLTPLLYFDRNERCSYHNAACLEWLRLPAEAIAGQPLRDIVEKERYVLIAPLVARTLAGETVDYERPWRQGGRSVTYKIRQLPYAPENAGVAGFYVMAIPLRTEASVAPVTLPGSAAAGRDRESKAAVDTTGREPLIEADPRERLGRALHQGEFLLFAQKILSLKNGAPEPECYEILLRLQEEERYLLPPGGFIPVAERYGMLEEIDRWVVRTLLYWCSSRRRNAPGWRTPLFSVNLSGMSIANGDFAGFVRQTLADLAFPARALCFEIGQDDAMAQVDAVRGLMAALKPTGCRFSIDGVRTTKAALFAIQNLEADFLKIESAIVGNIARDAAALADMVAINSACAQAGVRTIAEFVETKETLDKLREIGADYVQGFGVARPAPLGKLLAPPA